MASKKGEIIVAKMPGKITSPLFREEKPTDNSQIFFIIIISAIILLATYSLFNILASLMVDVGVSENLSKGEVTLGFPLLFSVSATFVLFIAAICIKFIKDHS